jgi:FkbH-like protein
MNDLIDSIGGLTPEQLDLLELHLGRLQKENYASTSAPIVARHRSSNICPLSMAQRGDWFREQLTPKNTASNISVAVRIRGPLDVRSLERSLAETVRRHEILRTTFDLVDGQPVQVISPSSSVELPSANVLEFPIAEREERARLMATAESQRPFDLKQGSLLRTFLIQLDEKEHILVITIHHIVCDRWSHGVLLRDILTLYHAFSRNLPPSLPSLPVQYADFVVWQHERLQGTEMQKQFAYWKQRLEGAPAFLSWPTDFVRAANRSKNSKKYPLAFSKELLAEVKAFCHREALTRFTVLLASFKTLLFRYTEEPDIVIGSLIANRNRPEIENLVGQFANPVVLRTRLSGELYFRQLLEQVSEMNLAAQENQDLPFEKIVQDLQPPREAGRTPFFQVVFNFQKGQSLDITDSDLKVDLEDLLQEKTDFDMLWLLEETAEGIFGSLRYDADLFTPDTIEHLVTAYSQILQAAVRQPDIRLSQFNLPSELEAQTRAAKIRREAQTIVVTANFTADPIKETLAFWMRELDIPAQIEIAPYDQVFQQLLDPTSALSRNKLGANVALLRLEDWHHYQTAEIETSSPLFLKENLLRNVNDFVAALKSSLTRSEVPHILCVCPASPAVLSDTQSAAILRQIESVLFTELNAVQGLQIIPADELSQFYPVKNYYDEVSDKIGHIPYTPAFYAALGTIIVRKIHAIQSKTYKVIVTDCDQTLWKGVCAEDGWQGVKIDESCLAFQKFLAACQSTGMLLCLCSKNNEQDVVEVFERRPDMLLKQDQIISRRVNWLSKAANLQSLAEELQLGLDSFIFIDDSQLECAEVMAACPEVLTIQLPTKIESLEKFLRHIWAFDRARITEEDKKRTALYRQNIERERFRQESLSFADFLADLNLRVRITETSPQEIGRVSQLTQRTNQFNTTTIGRSEAEIQSLMAAEEYTCLSVSVEDRFGEYGLVGVIVFKMGHDSIDVASLLLSCRVLGRGVEHRMVRRLGEIAERHGLKHVTILYQPTPRNQPARDFLRSIVGVSVEKRGDGILFKLPVEVTLALTHSPIDPNARLDKQPVNGTEASKAPGSVGAVKTTFDRAAGSQSNSARQRRIATELNDAEQILQVIHSHNYRKRYEAADVYVEPRMPIERMLADLWAEILQLDRVGANDNFFSLGGHSLLATLLLSRIRDTFQVEMPLSYIFEVPTVAGLAAVIEQSLIEQVDAEEMAEIRQGLNQLSDEEVKKLLADEVAQMSY